MPKLKWKVSEAPTGQYRSFFKRGWPSAEHAGEVMVALRCEDSYVPALVREGKHSEITIAVADRRGGPQFKWRTLKRRAATIEEAKEIAQSFFDANQEFFGLEKGDKG